MFTPSRLALLILFTLGTPALAQKPQFGQPISEADLASWDISIGPDGKGLPPGRGTAAQGADIYLMNCQACHGEKGAGRPNDALVGGIGSLASDKPPLRTVGSYWPYATTLFDYVRRAMPFPESKSLTSDELYAITAYILHLNGIIGEQDANRRSDPSDSENAKPSWFHTFSSESLNKLRTRAQPSAMEHRQRKTLAHPGVIPFALMIAVTSGDLT